MTKTHSEYKKEIKAKHPTIILLDKYTKATNRIKVQCDVCGKIWEPYAYSLSDGKGCPHCSAIQGSKNNQGKTGLKNQSKFIKEMNSINPNIEIIGVYVNTHTNVKCKCKICKSIWEAKPYALLQNHGCPRCAKSGTSFMEQFILHAFKTALGNSKVLSRDKKAIGKELDIYIPDQKLAIEPGNWYLHEKRISVNIQKKELCKKNGIRLITVYDKFNPRMVKPFKTDCYVFEEDLNKEDHSIIIELTKQLLREVGIKETNNLNWDKIEELAYINSKAMNHEEFVKRINNIHPNISVLDTYKNSNKRLRVRCNKCGYEWQAVPGNMMAGDGCRQCGAKKAHEKFIKKRELFEEEVKRANPDIEIIGQYMGRHKKVKAKCLICGHVWYPQASSLLRGSNHKGWKTIHKQMSTGK